MGRVCLWVVCVGLLAVPFIAAPPEAATAAVLTGEKDEEFKVTSEPINVLTEPYVTPSYLRMKRSFDSRQRELLQALQTMATRGQPSTSNSHNEPQPSTSTRHTDEAVVEKTRRLIEEAFELLKNVNYDQKRAHLEVFTSNLEKMLNQLNPERLHEKSNISNELESPTEIESDVYIPSYHAAQELPIESNTEQLYSEFMEANHNYQLALEQLMKSIRYYFQFQVQNPNETIDLYSLDAECKQIHHLEKLSLQAFFNFYHKLNNTALLSNTAKRNNLGKDNLVSIIQPSLLRNKRVSNLATEMASLEGITKESDKNEDPVRELEELKLVALQHSQGANGYENASADGSPKTLASEPSMTNQNIEPSTSQLFLDIVRGIEKAVAEHLEIKEGHTDNEGSISSLEELFKKVSNSLLNKEVKPSGSLDMDHILQDCKKIELFQALSLQSIISKKGYTRSINLYTSAPENSEFEKENSEIMSKSPSLHPSTQETVPNIDYNLVQMVSDDEVSIPQIKHTSMNQGTKVASASVMETTENQDNVADELVRELDELPKLFALEHSNTTPASHDLTERITETSRKSNVANNYQYVNLEKKRKIEDSIAKEVRELQQLGAKNSEIIKAIGIEDLQLKDLKGASKLEKHMNLPSNPNPLVANSFPYNVQHNNSFVEMRSYLPRMKASKPYRSGYYWAPYSPRMHPQQRGIENMLHQLQIENNVLKARLLTRFHDNVYRVRGANNYPINSFAPYQTTYVRNSNIPTPKLSPLDKPYPYTTVSDLQNATLKNAADEKMTIAPESMSEIDHSEFTDEMKRELRDGKVILLSDSVVRSNFDSENEDKGDIKEGKGGGTKEIKKHVAGAKNKIASKKFEDGKIS